MRISSRSVMRMAYGILDLEREADLERGANLTIEQELASQLVTHLREVMLALPFSHGAQSSRRP
jgi:hypothetical protein